MIHASTILAVLGCLLAFSSFNRFVSGSPVDTPVVAKQEGAPATGLPDGYTRSKIEWKGTLKEGGELIYLSGWTFDEIDAQAKALDPAYTIFGEAPPPTNHTGLSARQTQAVHCGWPPTWAMARYEWAIQDGIGYLRGITGSCRANPGPGSCGRVSCSWASAVYYCNDNTSEHWEPCAWIGDVAAEILYWCPSPWGQAFDQRNWNTIVAAGDC